MTPASEPKRPFIEEEIREQPDVLRRVLGATRAEIEALVEPGRYRRIHLVGCGDMRFAACSVAWYARLATTLEVHAWRAMDFRWIAQRLDPEDLVVCASVSGRTPRTIEAAKSARERGVRVLGITDNVGSPLCNEVDGVALLRTSPAEELARGEYPGYHHQIAQTKSYSAALLAQLVLIRRAAGKSAGCLEEIPDVVSGTVDDVLPLCRVGASNWFGGRDRVSVLGSGGAFPVASYGAAKLLEYAIPAHAQCLEEFNHLEIFLADESTLAVVLVQDEAARERLAGLLEAWEKIGLRALIVGPAGTYPGERSAVLPLSPAAPHLEPFRLAVALQCVAYRGARALGRDVNAWLGGVRTEVHNDASQTTVRGALSPDEGGRG